MGKMRKCMNESWLSARRRIGEMLKPHRMSVSRKLFPSALNTFERRAAVSKLSGMSKARINVVFNMLLANPAITVAVLAYPQSSRFTKGRNWLAGLCSSSIAKRIISPSIISMPR